MFQSLIDRYLYKRRDKPLSESTLRQKRLVRQAFAAILFYSGYTKRLRRRVVQTGLPSWRILSYPHIADPEELPYPIRYNEYVRPKTFEKNLRFLNKHFNVVSLPSLLDAINKGEAIPHDTISITFDCCWMDFHVYALPLLQRYQVPATVFVPTAYPASYFMFWHDTLRLAMVILKNMGHPFPKISSLGDEFYDYIKQFDEDELITEQGIALLIDCLKHEDPAHRFIVFQQILDEVHLYGELPEFSAFANWEEIREIAESELITIGSHGEGYKILPELTREELAADMREGLKKLRDQRIKPLEVLSLPYGRYDPTLLINLSEMGLRFALGEEVGLNIDPAKHGTLVLERVRIDEASASSNSMFASRMLAVPIPTQLYLGKKP